MFSRSMGDVSCERLTQQIEELSILHIVQKSDDSPADTLGNIFEETDFWSV